MILNLFPLFYYFYRRFMDFVSLKYRLLLLLVHRCHCLSFLAFMLIVVETNVKASEFIRGAHIFRTQIA